MSSKQILGVNFNICRIIIALALIAMGLFMFYLSWSKNDSSLIIIGVWPMIIGLWLGGADISSGHHNNNFDGGDGEG